MASPALYGNVPLKRTEFFETQIFRFINSLRQILLANHPSAIL